MSRWVGWLARVSSMGTSGRYAKGEAKRQEILEVALALIAEHGFKKSTLREIGSAVGLSNAGVLHYFGSKEELFAEVLRLRDRSPSDDGAGDGEGDGEDGGDRPAPFRLEHYVDVIAGNAEVAGLVHLFVSLSAEAVEPEHKAHDFFVDRYDAVRRRAAAAVRAEIDEGRWSPDIDPDRLAVILIALADGLQLQWLLDDSVDMADHLSYLIDLIGLRS